MGVGKLLVASRGLGDPSFAETVILLVHYDTQSVVGLVLNRRTNFPLSRVLSDFKAAKNRSDAAYRGGPVETTTVLALYQPSVTIEGADHVFDKVYLITSKPVLEQILPAQPDPDIFRVYLGHAGWNRNQLQREVELGMWFVFPADTKVVLSSDPDSLWRQMIGRTELQFADNRPVD